MIGMLGTSVIANKGNVGMVKKMLRKGATDSKNYKCHSSFLWFSMGQDDNKQGVTPYTTNNDWRDQSVNWSHILTTAKGHNGDIEEAGMDHVLGSNRKTVFQDLVNLCL